MDVTGTLVCTRCTFKNLDVLNYCEMCDFDLTEIKSREKRCREAEDVALARKLSNLRSDDSKSDQEENDLALARKFSQINLKSSQEDSDLVLARKLSKIDSSNDKNGNSNDPKFREEDDLARALEASLLEDNEKKERELSKTITVAVDFSNLSSEFKAFESFYCSYCTEDNVKLESAGIRPSCGHSICVKCFQTRAEFSLRRNRRLCCHIPECKAPISGKIIKQLTQHDKFHSALVTKRLTRKMNPPKKPEISKVEPGDRFAVVWFTKNESADSPVDTVIIQSTCGNVIIPDAQSPQIVPNLNNDTEYRFVAASLNDEGSSGLSVASDPVCPFESKLGDPRSMFKSLTSLKDFEPQTVVDFLARNEASSMLSFHISDNHTSRNLLKKINQAIKKREDIKLYGGLTSNKAVEGTEICVNPVLVKQFIQKQAEFRRRGIPCKATFAFHGTAVQNIKSICTTNLDPARVGKNSGNRGYYGAGVYFGTKHVRCNHNTFIMALVLEGKRIKVPYKIGVPLRKGYQSHYGDNRSYGRDELVIFDKNQIIPIAVIHTNKNQRTLQDYDFENPSKNMKISHRVPPPPVRKFVPPPVRKVRIEPSLRKDKPKPQKQWSYADFYRKKFGSARSIT